METLLVLQNDLMQIMKGKSQLALVKHVLCELRRVLLACNFQHIFTHDLRLNIDAAVVQGASINLRTGVRVVRIEDNDIPAI
ncbi:hypothetical protein D3C72_1221430 [compost metagenome]